MKAYVITYYENQKGGTNNLQISKVVSTGLCGIQTHITYTSLKNKAKKRAEKYLAKFTK